MCRLLAPMIFLQFAYSLFKYIFRIFGFHLFHSGLLRPIMPLLPFLPLTCVLNILLHEGSSSVQQNLFFIQFMVLVGCWTCLFFFCRFCVVWTFRIRSALLLFRLLLYVLQIPCLTFPLFLLSWRELEITEVLCELVNLRFSYFLGSR